MAQSTVAADPLVPQRGLTRDQYDALVDTGALEGEPVELVEGVLVEVVPQGDAHDEVIEALNHFLVPRLPEPWRVRVHLPLAATERSEPEPDVAIARRLGPGRPTTAVLVVEVAFSSQRIDLVHKARVYAAAGVEHYWVVDVRAREVVVHRDPVAGAYGLVTRQAWSVPLEVLGVPVDLESLLRGTAAAPD